MSENLKRLQDKLQQQQKQNILNLNDFVIGEEGCKLLSDFLRENCQFSTIDIRGNNISPSGFSKICDALKNNIKVKTILAEWNNIGAKPEGLLSLKNLMEENPSITVIDLKNNNIKADGALIISQILTLDTNLVSLDLKCNEIGSKGAAYIIEALEQNYSLKFLDINCNKIPEDIIQSINKLIIRNKNTNQLDLIQKKHQQKTLMQKSQEQFPSQQKSTIQQASDLRPQAQTSANQFKKDPSQQMSQNFAGTSSQIDEQDPAQKHKIMQTTNSSQPYTLGQLDEILKNERIRVQEMKRQLQKELDEEKKSRQNLEQTLTKMRSEYMKKEEQISDLEIKHNNLITENHVLQLEMDNLKKDILDKQQERNGVIDQLQDHLNGNQKEISDLEEAQLNELNQNINDSEQFREQALREQQLRYDQLDEKYKQLKLYKLDLEQKVSYHNENIIRNLIESEEAQKNLQFRVEDDIRKRQENTLQNMKNKLLAAQNALDTTIRANDDITKEMQTKQAKTMEKIRQLDGEILNFRKCINDSHKLLSKLNLSIDKKKNLHIQSDVRIQTLQEQFDELNTIMIRMKDSQKYQLEHTQFEHSNERRVTKDNIEQLHLRICELEKAYRNQEAENAKIKSNYERLCNSIQQSVNKTIMETMVYHQSLLHQNILKQPITTAIPLQSPLQMDRQQLESNDIHNDNIEIQ